MMNPAWNDATTAFEPDENGTGVYDPGPAGIADASALRVPNTGLFVSLVACRLLVADTT